MKFATLFEIGVRHSFYADERCPDFEINPSSATQRLLSRHRGVAQSWPGGVRIAVPVEASGQPSFPFPPSAACIFDLALNNSDFVLFTNLRRFRRKRVPRFTSLNASVEGELKLVESPAPFPPGVFAQVEIRLDHLGPVPTNLHVAFEAKKVRWTYYCITDLGGKSSDLSIRDSVAPEPPLFQRPIKPDENDPIAMQLAARYPELDRVRFLTARPVVCSQLPAERLELRLQDESLLTPLPLPSVRNVAKIANQDSLFQIVRYLSQPLP